MPQQNASRGVCTYPCRAWARRKTRSSAPAALDGVTTIYNAAREPRRSSIYKNYQRDGRQRPRRGNRSSQSRKARCTAGNTASSPTASWARRISAPRPCMWGRCAFAGVDPRPRDCVRRAGQGGGCVQREDDVFLKVMAVSDPSALCARHPIRAFRRTRSRC